MLFSLAMLGILGLASVAVGELVVRGIAPRSDGEKLGVPLADSARVYGLRPNASCLHTGVTVTTNSLGFRELEYPRDRKPGVRRVVVLGDSFTLGVGVEFDAIYAKRLERRLGQTLGPVEVINFAVSGYNTAMELATFREVAAAFQPDLVILGYVLNDTECVTAARDVTRPTESHRRRGALSGIHLWLKDQSYLYTYLSPKLGQLAGLFGARYAVGYTHEIAESFRGETPGWLESRAALLEIAGDARRIGADLLVCVFPMILDFRSYPLESAHQRVTDFCREHSIDVLDLLPITQPQRQSDLIVFLDGHPNAFAHGLWADAIFEHLTTRMVDWSDRAAPGGTQ